MYLYFCLEPPTSEPFRFFLPAFVSQFQGARTWHSHWSEGSLCSYLVFVYVCGRVLSLCSLLLLTTHVRLPLFPDAWTNGHFLSRVIQFTGGTVGEELWAPSFPRTPGYLSSSSFPFLRAQGESWSSLGQILRPSFFKTFSYDVWGFSQKSQKDRKATFVSTLAIVFPEAMCPERTTGLHEGQWGGQARRKPRRRKYYNSIHPNSIRTGKMSCLTSQLVFQCLARDDFSNVY